MRSSLLVRLLLASLAVAVCAIAATAYITTRSTTGRLERERSRSLADDLAIRDELAAHAVRHPTWDGVGEIVDRLAASTGRRITLTATDGTTIADAGAADDEPLSGAPTALVDVLTSLADASELAPAALRATGGQPLLDTVPLVPDQLVDASSPEGAEYVAATEIGTACLLSPADGRVNAVWIVAAGPAPAFPCDPLTSGTSTGNRYIDLNNTLATDIASCTTARGHTTWLAAGTSGLAGVVVDDVEAFRECATPVRRAAFEDLVAPPTLLYLTDPVEPEPGWIERAGGRRIVLALAAVLAVALVATLLLAARLLRPIRRMTRVARRMAADERGARVRVRGNDELARLGQAFNAMAESIEAGERERQQLVSDVAHELRNPLTNVRGYLEGAKDGVVELDPQFVDLLLDETVHLQHLVADLQDVALADAGRLRLHVEPIDVADVIAHVVAANTEHARRRTVTLTVTGDASARVSGDIVRLRQVLGNLVANALRYTPPGGRIDIDLAARAGTVRIVVSDTGVGIDPEHLPHLFDRFYRADASRTRGTGGSGLGLAICKYLVEAHQGTIEVASEVGAGTTFTISLPALDPSSAELPPVRAQLPASRPGR